MLHFVVLCLKDEPDTNTHVHALLTYKSGLGVFVMGRLHRISRHLSRSSIQVDFSSTPYLSSLFTRKRVPETYSTLGLHWLTGSEESCAEE